MQAVRRSAAGCAPQLGEEALSTQASCPFAIGLQRSLMPLCLWLYAQVEWFDDAQYVHVRVSILGLLHDGASWSLSFPKQGTALARSACTGRPQDCTLANAPACIFRPSAQPIDTQIPGVMLGPDEISVQSLSAQAGCSPGSPAPGGSNLLYGLKVGRPHLLQGMYTRCR